MNIDLSDSDFAILVDQVAKLISGAPFPSKKSLTKAREVVGHIVLSLEDRASK